MSAANSMEIALKQYSLSGCQGLTLLIEIASVVTKEIQFL